MSIPQNSQPRTRGIPTESQPDTQASETSNTTGRRTENYHHDLNSFISSMVVKSVSHFGETYLRKKNPDQQPTRQKTMLQTVYTEYKKPVTDMLTMIGGASPASVRPFVGAFKSIFFSHLGVDSYMNGLNYNLYSGPANGLGGAVAGILSSALFCKGSSLRTKADLAFKHMQAGIKNPKFTSLTPDSGALAKALLTVLISKVTAKLTEDKTMIRPESAGNVMTNSDEKYQKQLLTATVYAYSMQALVGLPGIKEGLADFLFSKSRFEKEYEDFLAKETAAINKPEIQEKLAEAKPAVQLLAERAKSIRIEIPQQMVQLSSVMLLSMATCYFLNRANNENQNNYLKMNNHQ